MRALDLFCGAGGATLGLQAAGFEVVGVDNDPACGDVYPGHFILGDALNPPTSLDDFDLIWASPPCPAYSRATNTEAKANHPDLVAPVRDMIAGHPCTVIENVVGSPLRRDLILTAPMFGLENLVRERWFELSWWPGLVPPPPRHAIGKCYVISSFGVTTATRLATGRFGQGLRPFRLRLVGLSTLAGRTVFGVSTAFRGSITSGRSGLWVLTFHTRRQLGNSIPPAYAEFIANNALEMAAC